LLVATDCDFTLNSASHGGAIDGSAFTLVRCTIAENAAPGGYGGGLTWSGNPGFGHLVVTSCTIRQNTAAFGAGISADGVGDGFGAPTGTIASSTIVDNVASVDGGGVHASQFGSGFVAMRNSLIAGNSAGGNGGGISRLGTVTVRGCTLADNSATNGSALFTTGSGSTVSTCIVWGNTGPAVRGGETLTYCDVEGGFAGTGNIALDPQFIDAGVGNYHLAMSSPCIDAGNPALTGFGETDIDEEVRLIAATEDMGADETTYLVAAWQDLAHALHGTFKPTLAGWGLLTAGSPATLNLTKAIPSAPAWMVIGASAINAPLKGGVMVPNPDFIVGPLAVGPTGTLLLSSAWPLGVPSGFATYFQHWMPGGGGPAGYVASNALAAVVP
jgi:hypothetical protein